MASKLLHSAYTVYGFYLVDYTGHDLVDFSKNAAISLKIKEIEESTSESSYNQVS